MRTTIAILGIVLLAAAVAVAAGGPAPADSAKAAAAAPAKARMDKAKAAAEAKGKAAADPAQAPADSSHGDMGVGPVQKVELGKPDPKLAAQGKDLFGNRCTVCHALDKKKVGPPLGKVFDQRTPEFIMNMILNAPQMEQKDPAAKKLVAEYKVAMPQLGLNRKDARAILEYLREQAGGGEGK